MKKETKIKVNWFDFIENEEIDMKITVKKKSIKERELRKKRSE